MPYNKELHHRRSVRLQDYDYSSDGLYFITICTADKKCIFGRVHNGEMILNDWGKIARDCLLEIPKHFQKVKILEYIIMPNHVHFIIVIDSYKPTSIDKIKLINTNIVGAGGAALHGPVGAHNCAPLCQRHDDIIVCSANNGAQLCAPTQKRKFGDKLNTLAAAIRGYKSTVSKQIGRSVFQRNYYEHIIRDNNEHGDIATYIINNPATWDADKLYVKSVNEFIEKLDSGKLTRTS